MITLKDIKVSKNRIPVQNTMWIRPIGGLAFKIYYPHGGDWAELNLDGTSGPDSDIKEIEKEVAALKEEVKELSEEFSYFEKTQPRILLRLNNIQENVNSMQLSIQRLYSSIDITHIILTKAFPIGELAQINPIEYGIDNVYLNAIINNTVSKATMPGYENTFNVFQFKCEEQLMLSPIPWLCSYLYFKEDNKRTVFTFEGSHVNLVPGGLKAIYLTRGEEQIITEDMLYLDTTLPRENKEQISAEDFAVLGFTPEALQSLYAGTYNKVMTSQDMFLYKIEGIIAPDNNNPYSEFQLYGYAEAYDSTYVYEFYGALNDGIWSYDIAFHTEPGNVVPEDESEEI